MSDPLALSNFVATLLVFGAPVVSVLIENRRFRGDARTRWSDPTYWQLEAWQIAGLVLGVLLAKQFPGAALPGNEWLWPALGCAVGLAGVTLRWWAIRTLGVHFTRNLQVAAGQTVVVDGPYEYLRHPSYTGAILMFAGVGIGLGNALGSAACVVLPAIGFVRRIPREEALLRRELGEPYAEYASHTRRLLPGVW
jgi:protein-S-isoprenylcysteine O-methyltransferase Ste14